MSGLKPKPSQGLLRRRWQHRVGDYAVAVGWQANGRRLFVGDAAGLVSAFDAADGRLDWCAEAHAGGLLDLAPWPGGARLASAGQDGWARLWDADSGHQVAELPGDAAWVEHLAWSPDGRRLASSAGKQLRLWSPDGTSVHRCEPEPSTISAVAWAGNDEIVSAGYGRVAFRCAADGRVTETLSWQGSLISLALSTDGAIVACGSQDRTVHFWRRSNGEDSMMSGYPVKPAALAFDATGTLLATGGAEYVTVWSFAGDGPEGTEPGLLDCHARPVTALVFAPGSRRLASAAKDGSLLIWDLAADGNGTLVGAALGDGAIEAIAWHPDGGAVAAIDAAGGVAVWDCKDS
jgi:WD40 repeat protein